MNLSELSRAGFEKGHILRLGTSSSHPSQYFPWRNKQTRKQTTKQRIQILCHSKAPSRQKSALTFCRLKFLRPSVPNHMWHDRCRPLCLTVRDSANCSICLAMPHPFFYGLTSECAFCAVSFCYSHVQVLKVDRPKVLREWHASASKCPSHHSCLQILPALSQETSSPPALLSCLFDHLEAPNHGTQHFACFWILSAC